jgi:1-deoxy-D-xylulose-5-phosphate reductoisomerase
MRAIALLGATGSIGGSTLDVVARHPDRFRIAALSAQRNVVALADACARTGARYAVIAEAGLRTELAHALRERGSRAEALSGPQALIDMAALPEVDTVVAAIVGAAGLESTLAAARHGKRLLLANKEAIVMAGPLLIAAMHAGGGVLLPIDSEHNAVFQCLPRDYRGDPARHGVERIVLTASGGPFRGASAQRLRTVTPDEACAHPNWRMGRKISVDSATMMNKGLEVIEAHWLFGLPPERIEVAVHPQSIVHSLVAYRDGSVLAQLGMPDMRTAIAHALAWPDRVDAGVRALDLFALRQLDFEAPNTQVFRCLRLAYDALAAGGTAPAILNAANEVAVDAFLNGRLAFSEIPTQVEATLEALDTAPISKLETVIEADARARRHTAAALTQRNG